MTILNVEITEAEYKALEYISVSPEELAINFTKNRARIAIDEIVKLTTEYCLDNGVQLPATREEIITYAFDNGVVKTALQQNADMQSA